MSPGVAAVARSVGLDPSREPARFLTDLIRLLYAGPPGASPAADALARSLAQPAPLARGDAVHVPVPLSAATWSQAVFERPVNAGDLVAAIVADRRAALLAYGLAGLDDESLSFFDANPALLAALYAEGAAALAAFGDSVRIRAGRVATPGGTDAVPLWELVVGEPVDQPARFLGALLTRDRGRLGYLYGLVGGLDPPQAAFALGAWMRDPARQAARFTALGAAAVRGFSEWTVESQPFNRPLNDLSFLLMRMRVEPSGAPSAPASRLFWAAVFATDDPLASVPPLGGTLADPVDAAWLAEATSTDNQFARGDRLDQIAFGQRVFAGVAASDASHAVVAVRALRSTRSLVVTLERMGVADPGVYASAARQVVRLASRDPGRAFWSFAQLQGALAIVARMTQVGTIDERAAVALVTSLSAVPVLADGRYGGALAAWLDSRLLPLLPPSDYPENRLIAGLAGPRDASAPRLDWEGQAYRLDLSFAEAARLRTVRARQASYSADLAMGIHRVARALDRDRSQAQARAAAAALSALTRDYARELARPAPDVLAGGVRQPPPAGPQLAGAAATLSAAGSTQDSQAITRVVAELTDLVDTVLGEALLSMAYAIHLGDPNSTALLGRNVALRHDFGLAFPDAGQRVRIPWLMPRQNFRPGVAWHITGSALGLDVALAPLGLRRLSAGTPPGVPRLPSIEREAFAVAVALLDPRRLRDGDRDAIATAVLRGRARVEAIAAPAALDAVAVDLAFDARRRRAAHWTLANEPGEVPALFSLVELLALGGGAPTADLDAWGMAALASSSCPCTELMPARRWRMLEGRPQVGLVASAMSDLNLHVAVMLHALDVPAALAQPVLAAAMLEFIEGATPVHPGDWRALSRSAQAVPKQRIEDFVAAAAAVGGPLVPLDEEPVLP